MILEGALQVGKSFLGGGQVSGLEGLADGGKILLTLAYLEGISVGEWAVLAQTLNRAVFLLGAGEVSGLERLAQLLQIGSPLLKVRLQFLVNRTRGNRCG